jgi:PAS domain S-box-containing protein
LLWRVRLYPDYPSRSDANSSTGVGTIASPVRDKLEWHLLPSAAKLYVVGVILAGAWSTVALFPREWPPLDTFAALVLSSCLLSLWKVNLPIPLSSGSTLSVSFAANLTALLLLGPRVALVVTLAGAWTQSTVNVKRAYPLYRAAFSAAAAAVAMAAAGVAYVALGGEFAPSHVDGLAKPLIGTAATYFLLNTGLIAAAIALSTRQPILKIWRQDFLFSASSVMIVGMAGAAAAVVVVRGQHWAAILALAPVYLAYRTYAVFVGRLNDEHRHAAELDRQHGEAVTALLAARRSEQALAQEKERLAVTLRSIGDGVIASDLDGTILLINNAAEALTGWPRDEAVGRPLGSVFQSVDADTRKRRDDTIRAMAGSSGLRSSSVLVARDLSERPIEACATPLCDAEGRTVGMVLAFRDLSDALRAQQQQASATRLASLGLLAGGIAHDFNNTLTAIMGNISMVRAGTRQGVATSAALDEAEQACVRARQITWQLLTFSKGTIPVKKPVSLPRLLDEAAALALRGSHVTCAFDLTPDLWHVEADETQLVRVFTNLLINAQEAMPHGGVVTVRGENIFEVNHRSEHGLSVEPGAYVRITAIDHGIGIPQEHLPRIFDPYFSTKQRGSGLGLATAFSIVKNHGGFVGVTSDLGRGTAINVHFPAAHRKARREAPAAVASDGGLRPRVLVMDDEASVRTVTKNMLTFLGYEAEVVESGMVAIERFKAALEAGRPFDAVLLDLVVPGAIGGREAIGHLTGLDPAVRAVLVSGYAQDSSMSDYREYGFAAAMCKPYTMQDLQATLETVIITPPARVH